MKIIVLNGPPGCGKDTLGRILEELIEDACTIQFKDPMFDVARVILPFPEDEFLARYHNRELKEVPWDKLGGISCRELMIKISEEWMKPLLGKDVFGKLAVAGIENLETVGYETAVLTDSGFQEEFTTLQDTFGKENVHLVRLEREGFTFDGDSRGYIASNGSPFHNITLHEDQPFCAALNIKVVCK